MTESLLQYVTGFGLATGAGTKAAIPVLALGLLHHTPYFKLSREFEWIASPPVLAVLAVLILVELWADSHPDLGEWSDRLGYLTKWLAGFVAFAAATGKLDPGLVKLGASGLLGGGTAVGVHWLRNRIRNPFRSHVEDIHPVMGKAATLMESGVSAGLSFGAVLIPVVTLGAAAVVLGVSYAAAARVKARTVACVNAGCGKRIAPGVRFCPACATEQP